MQNIKQSIRQITTEITAFTNQVRSLKKLPVASHAVIKTYSKLIKELKTQQQLLQKELETRLLEWQPDLVKKVNSVTAIDKRATAELIIYRRVLKI